MYIYTYIYIYIYTCVCVSVSVSVCVCLCLCVCVSVHVRLCIQVYWVQAIISRFSDTKLRQPRVMSAAALERWHLQGRVRSEKSLQRISHRSSPTRSSAPALMLNRLAEVEFGESTLPADRRRSDEFHVLDVISEPDGPVVPAVGTLSSPTPGAWSSLSPSPFVLLDSPFCPGKERNHARSWIFDLAIIPLTESALQAHAGDAPSGRERTDSETEAELGTRSSLTMSSSTCSEEGSSESESSPSISIPPACRAVQVPPCVEGARRALRTGASAADNEEGFSKSWLTSIRTLPLHDLSAIKCENGCEHECSCNSLPSATAALPLLRSPSAACSSPEVDPKIASGGNGEPPASSTVTTAGSATSLLHCSAAGEELASNPDSQRPSPTLNMENLLSLVSRLARDAHATEARATAAEARAAGAEARAAAAETRASAAEACAREAERRTADVERRLSEFLATMAASAPLARRATWTGGLQAGDESVQVQTVPVAAAPQAQQLGERVVSMVLDTSGGQRLGIRLRSGSSVVDGVTPGLVMEWNAAHPGSEVTRGAELMEVNGVSGTANAMLEELRKGARVLKLRVRLVLPQRPRRGSAGLVCGV